MPVTDVKLDFARASYQRFVAKKSVNTYGCWIPKKDPRRDGYVRFSITKGSLDQAFGFGHPYRGEQTYYVHHLSYYMKTGGVPDGRTVHVSHLCHNPRCFNPEHLHAESAATNNSRKNCKFAVACPEPCCAGKPPIIICEHVPQCKAPGM